VSAVRIKICGVTTVADALLAVGLGADALGLNFYPRSPRCIDLATAARILDALPPFVVPVAVLVDQSLDEIVAQLTPLPRLRTIQRHGTPEVGTPFPFDQIVPFAVRDATSLVAIQHYLACCRAVQALPRAILVDAHVPGQAGGTGQTVPWHLLEGFDPGVPLILAGGLTPDNITEAIRRVRPYAVDVASGVESSPGRKGADKMRRFIDLARTAAD
jgi:phosphoribosylanthranilate isomerase